VGCTLPHREPTKARLRLGACAAQSMGEEMISAIKTSAKAE